MELGQRFALSLKTLGFWGDTVQRIVTTVTILYWALLSYSLLATTPWGLIGGADNLLPAFDPSAPLPSSLLHIFAYFTGTGLFLFSNPEKKHLRLWLIALVSHAIVFEFLQGYVPGRWTNPWDLIANLIGLSIAWKVFLRYPIKQFTHA